MSGDASTARRALACLDLTNLDDACDAAAVAELCARARSPHGKVAAVCVWPRFVAVARGELAETPIRIATVVNFPSGDLDLDHVCAMTRDVLAEGADEIDMVIPWAAFQSGNESRVGQYVRAVRSIAGGAVLKTILETGALGSPEAIGRTAALAIEGGADFLKTSTGKTAAGATPEAAGILLDAIAHAGRPVGLKVSGGVRSLEDAAGYLALCDRVMGRDWAGPATFRIGASGLLTALLAALDGTEAPAGGTGY